MAALDLDGIRTQIESVALASGRFDRVSGHEPEAAPGTGLTAAVWLDAIEPLPERSGLAATSVRVLWSLRLYRPMTVEPQDGIDPSIGVAAAELMEELSGDFDLGGEAAEVDLLGRYGTALGGKAGYARHDGGEYRTFTITVPVVLNDLWTQES